MRSRYKKFKEAVFLTRTDRFWRSLSLRVYLLFCKYYREVVFNAFSIQKIQRGRIFQRTDTVASSLFAFLQIIIEKRVLMCSRYKKFKEAEFFNELTGFIVEVLDTKNSKRQNFLTNRPDF